MNREVGEALGRAQGGVLCSASSRACTRGVFLLGRARTWSYRLVGIIEGERSIIGFLQNALGNSRKNKKMNCVDWTVFLSGCFAAVLLLLLLLLSAPRFVNPRPRACRPALSSGGNGLCDWLWLSIEITFRRVAVLWRKTS
jgi:hypothetical protein